MNEMDLIVDLAREAVLLTLVLAAPILLTGLIVAAVVGILQAATQVQEQTLSLIPKIAAMLLAAVVTGPWIITRLVEFSRRMFGALP
ncbi:MAG TPA: flagellar biosynthetic protein FliQ [Phycisphaerae bacterium]|nr:flagellar biosynthetic protein FliQ [Phycisphaerae bacterium]